MMRRALGVLGTALLAASAAWSSVRLLPAVDAQTRPDVLLISVDTLRADRLDPYGGGLNTSPALAALARDGVVFENAFAQGTWTLPGHASMLTGLYPSRHLVFEDNSSIRKTLPYLPASLKSLGYRTIGWASHVRFQGYGFERGFDDLEVALGGAGTKAAEPTIEDALAWLNARPRTSQPLFTFLHLDRKSTRLNSSHLVISYAVFCLIKKNSCGAS